MLTTKFLRTNDSATELVFTGNSGTAQPSSNSVIFQGTGPITVTGSGNTLTFTATGLGTGDCSTNVASSADGQMTVFSGTSGKLLRTMGTQTGFLRIDGGIVSVFGISALGQTFVQRATAALMRTDLGLGTVSTQNSTTIAITGGTITGITDLAIEDGGTGASTASSAFNNLSPATTLGDLIYKGAVDHVRLPLGTNGQVLKINNGAPAWMPDTYGAPTDATYITQTPSPTLLNEFALSTLATGLLKNATGTGILTVAVQGTDYYAPSGTDVAIADGGTGASTKTAAFDNLSPTTTRGDLIFQGASGNARLAVGANGQILTSNGTDPVWANLTPTFITQTPSSSLDNEQPLSALPTGLLWNTNGTGVLTTASQGVHYYAPAGTDVAISDGGTGASSALAAFNNLSPMTTSGDMIFRSGANNARLAIGTEGQFLKVVSGAPAWVTDSDGDVKGPSSSLDNQLVVFSGTTGKLLKAANILRFNNDSIFLGLNAGNASMTGHSNCGFGEGSLDLIAGGDGNCAFGRETLGVLTEGLYHSAFGFFAMGSAIGGDSSCAFGADALLVAENPVNLVCIGARSMYSMNGGLRCTSLGFETLHNATTANDCLAAGYQSQFSNLVHQRNVSLGNYTLYNCIEDDNVAIGHEVMYSSTVASNNLGAGTQALRNNINGSNIVALGGGALKECANGSGCVGVGINALALNNSNNITGVGYNVASANVSGLRVTAVGFQGLLSSNADDQTSLGFEALKLVTGPGNTAVGSLAGAAFANLTNCTFLGKGADAGADNLTNAAALGQGAIVSQNNALVLGNNADVGIGTSTPKGRLHVQGGSIYHKAVSGFAGSYHQMLQAGIQTTDATTTDLITYAVGAGQMVVIDGIIAGFQSDKTDAMSASFYFPAYRGTSGTVQIIGTPHVVIKQSAGAAATNLTIDVDAATQTVRVRVTGVAAQTWNWFARYSLTPLETNA